MDRRLAEQEPRPYQEVIQELIATNGADVESGQQRRALIMEAGRAAVALNIDSYVSKT